MVDWRFWRTRTPRVDYGPDPEPPTVDESADEGVAMAEQAALMAVKNRILVDAHLADDSFEPQQYVGTTRDIVLALASESSDAAERTRADRRNAALLKGRGIHQHDYRSRDVDNLVLREESFEEVGRRLRALADDDARLLALVERARESAWAELAREMERSLDRAEVLEFGDQNYQAERAQRLHDFIAVDLLRLQMQTQRTRNQAAEEPAEY